MKTPPASLLLGTLTLAVIIGVFSFPPIAQSPGYHAFCDTRRLWGLPNAANVLSNLPFVFVGARGWWLLKESRADRSVQLIYFFLFTGIFLTGFGSGWYHLSPDNDRLVFDRLPMTLVFMSLLAAVIGESFGAATGAGILGPLLLTGIGSVLWWHHTEILGRGDLRLYVLVQYYPPLLIILLFLLYPVEANRLGRRELLWAVAWYVVAKLLDVQDCRIYDTGEWIGGHTLKHFAAAVSSWYLTELFRKKNLVYLH